MKPALLLLLAGLSTLTPACRGTGGPAETGDEPGGAAQTPPGPPSILLISIDTTRADHLGCYGRQPSPTPHIDRWADEGVVFERALTPIPITLPAHTTLLTGTLPWRHGVRDNGVYRVPPDLPTLAETLAEAGYDTAAVVGAAVLDRQYGLDRGFGTYDDVKTAGGGLAIAERRAEQVTDAALARAEHLRPPFLLFVHYFDPHAAYDPPAAFAERYRGEPYVGEIASVDAEVGRLGESLEARGLLGNAVVVVVSDHGESLGEHGEATHGVFLYQSTLHVPLVVRAPGWPRGRRVSGTVSLADVAPTLLDLAGLPALEHADGRSLQAAVDGEADPRWLPLESEFGLNSYGWSPLVGLTDGQLKWVGAPRPELYDLTTDPNERHDLAGGDEPEVRRLSGLWRERVTGDRRSRPLEGESSREDTERMERLAALGYVAATAAPAPGDTTALPDPKDAIGTLDLINEARALMGKHRLPEAQSVLGRALKSSPRNVSGQVLLGISHLMAGDPRGAIAPLERAARLAPANADVQFNLGLAQAGVGSVPGAEAAFRRAVELAPRNHDAAMSLVDLLLNTGRPDEAWAALQAGRAEGLGSPPFDFLEGKLAAVRGDRGRARQLLERALSGGLTPEAAGQARAILRELGSS